MVRALWNDHTLTQTISADPPRTRATIDPNTAPWWELTTLREIGVGLAREIVEYRQGVAAMTDVGGDGRAFRQTSDLQKVRGIGPKTVQRMANELAFTTDRPNRNQPQP